MKTAVHQYEDKLLEFAYGELPTSEADAVEAHVRDCARCTKALAEIRAVRSTMATLPLEPAPDAGLESLLAYAEQTAARSRAATSPWASWRRFLAPLASAMALLVVGVVAWRAKETFDPDAGLLAVQAEREQASAPSRKGGAPDLAAAPAPVAQPVAEPEGAPPTEEPTFAAAEPEAPGKLEGKKQASFGERLDRGDDKDRGLAPQSVTKRAKAKEAQVAKPMAPLADDYSNAAQRGALPGGGGVATGKRDGVAYGLGGGALGTAGNEQAVGGLATSSATEERKAEQKKSAGPEAIVAAAPAPPPAPAPKASFGLPGMGSSKVQAPASSRAEAEADELALSATDSLAADRDSKTAERERASTRSKTLAEARTAGASGDRQSEIDLLKKVLASGVTGAERVETLKRLCDAYEALSLYEQADAYCDTLLREYPSSAAAQAVTSRRNAVQRAAPAKVRAAPADRSPAEPASTPAY